MNFLKDRIGERAATPRAIRIIPAMPLTGVGKIFKPELKLREIETALAEALHGADVRLATLKALSDSTHGTVVDVRLAEGADRQLARAVLGQFPFQLRLRDGHD
jgi:fatty-acyl-CoA synthase